MLKKSFILFSFLFLVFTLSGCAKKELPYHSWNYYYKHEKQAKKVRNFCNKNYPGWQEQMLDTNLTREQIQRLTNCSNAERSVKYHQISNEHF